MFQSVSTPSAPPLLSTVIEPFAFRVIVYAERGPE